MNDRPGGPSGAGFDLAESATPVAPTVATRMPHLDNLRTAMVAWIIGGHALLGYTKIGGWQYAEVHEVAFAPLSELVLLAVLGPTALFVIGTFFFLSGLVGEDAMARKGPARFAIDRLLRLGIPFVVFVALVWPLFMWLAYLAAGRRVSYWWAFTHLQPFLDSGPLWFAEVLLYVSLGYAAWRWTATRVGRPAIRQPASLRGRYLFGVALGVAVASFAVRLWFPARSTQILGLHLWQWPQCVAMFGLGGRGGAWRLAGSGAAAAMPGLRVDRRGHDCGRTGSGGRHWGDRRRRGRHAVPRRLALAGADP